MAVNYDVLAADYEALRIPDHRISGQIKAHLKTAGSAINVGAGTGAHDPNHCRGTALEPSPEMIWKRAISKGKAV